MKKKPLSERIGATKEKITKVDAKTGKVSTALTNARKRWKHYHDLAVSTYAQSQKAQEKADRLRQNGQPEKAAEVDREGMKLEAQSMNAHAKAQEWISKIKQLKQREEGLDNTEEQLRARLAKLQAEKGPRIKGDKVTGGTAEKRLQVCMLASAANCRGGKRPNFYSQVGSFDVAHCLSGPSRSHRDDCSSWFTSVYRSCGLPDPNGTGYTGGYTGTLGNHGRQISREEAKRTPGAAVLFGSSPFHHVEAAIGDGTEETIGHGSSPVDKGTFDLLPGPVQFRKYPHS
jgi:hypothetical protein